MNKINYCIIAWPVLFIMTQACFEEDKRVSPYPFETFSISDSVQLNRSFFDFESGRVVAVNRTALWQLGFECGADGYRIITNSGAHWFIFNTGNTTSAATLSMPLNLSGMYDTQSLWPDSTAVGKWCTFKQGNYAYTGNIYLMGKYSGGAFKEVKEIIFLERTDTSYTFSYHDRVTDKNDTAVIRKNSKVNFTYYSFPGDTGLELEPPKENYDLVFCSYYDLATLFGQTIPYQVAGALLNVYDTEVALDSITGYGLIDLETALAAGFTKQRDIPGYNWKSVTVDITGGTASYAIKTQYSYLVKTREGNYYKMRFISYTLDGKSGFPRFEFSRLE